MPIKQQWRRERTIENKIGLAKNFPPLQFFFLLRKRIVPGFSG